jgi:hypothetical protein
MPRPANMKNRFRFLFDTWHGALSIVILCCALSCSALARGSGDVPCLSAMIPTNDTIVLVSCGGDLPEVVSNRIRHLAFLSPRQIADAWKLYSVPFHDETPHSCMIRVNRETGHFLYSLGFSVAKDLSCISDVPLEGLDIGNAMHLSSVEGPDYRPLQYFDISSSNATTNLSALAAASNLEYLNICETPVTSLDFISDMTNLSCVAVLGAPISDFSPVKKAMRNVSPKKKEFTVSLNCTLGRDFDSLKEIAKGKPNIRLDIDPERLLLPRSFARSRKWEKLLGEELLSRCEQDEEDDEDEGEIP